MYEAFFGFRERPFQLTPNPRYLFLNPAHREALATLRYGLTSSMGITLLLGEAGTGKTTLLRAALNAERRPEQRHAVLNNPTLSPTDFFEILAETFRLPNAGSKGRFLMAFERDLLDKFRAGCRTALVVDEAQSLTHELFEEIRLLANLETETAKLVNVVLVGQPELADRLNDPSLRQLKQRVILRCGLEPLDLEWTGAYIAARLQVAGAIAGHVFTSDAVRTIYEASRGIPRTIGVICENALIAGYAAQKKPIGPAAIVDVCRDLDIPVNGNGRPQAPPLALPALSTAPPDDGPARRATPAAYAARVQPEPAPEPADGERTGASRAEAHRAGEPAEGERRRGGRRWFVGRMRTREVPPDEEPEAPPARNRPPRIFGF